jgi:hypothetical protein
VMVTEDKATAFLHLFRSMLSSASQQQGVASM